MKYREGLHEHHGRPHDLDGHFRLMIFSDWENIWFSPTLSWRFRVQLMQNLEMTIFGLIQAIEMYCRWLIGELAGVFIGETFIIQLNPTFCKLGRWDFGYVLDHFHNDDALDFQHPPVRLRLGSPAS